MRGMLRVPAETIATAILIAAAGLMTPAVALAQAPAPEMRSNPSGFHLAAALNGSALTTEESDEYEAGGGGSAEIGWGLNRTATLFLRLAGSSIQPDFGDDYALAHADLGLRFHLGDASAAWIPYLEGALSGIAASFETGLGTVDVSGHGFTAGAGILYFFSPSFAADIGLRLTFGEFTEAEAGGLSESFELGTTTSRFDVGIGWWAG